METLETNDPLEIQEKLNELLSLLLQNLRINISAGWKGTLTPRNNINSNALGDGKEEYLNILLERKKSVRTGRFISSGFAQLDELIGGIFEGELIVIGARPGIGKTSLILSMMRDQMKNHLPVGIYSFEMTREALTDRIISLTKMIPVSQLRSGKMTDKELKSIEEVFADLAKSRLFLIEGSLFCMKDFVDTLGSLVNEYGLKLLYIDYLQLMISEHQRKNREQEISELMRFLKSVAIKYKIAVIITSQMNRYVEWRGGSKRPILSDLRESGTIEEIADKVLLVYRPETSGIILDEENNSTIGKAEIIVAKNRLGPTGDVILSFDKNFGLFESISWDKKVFPSLDLPDNPFNERPF